MLRAMLWVGATVAVLVGCGDKVTYIDDGDGGDTQTAPPCPGADCLPPGCPATAPTQGSSCDLPDMTECRYADPVMGDCHTTWQCSPVYPEQGAPSEWVFAGQDGVCECVAVTCDPGDLEVSECIPDAACYFVDDPCSDGGILCADTALPQHGCPLTQPADGEPCTEDGKFCDYPLGSDCFDSVMCDAGSWWWVGGGCYGGEGGASSSSSSSGG